MPRSRPHLRAEVWRLVRFGGVGACVTAIYAGMTLALTEVAGLSAVLSSLVGHVCAATASYLGHRMFTFQSTRGHSVTLPRFLIFLAFSLLLNASGTFLIVQVFGLPVLVAIVAITILIIALSYVSGRLWIFMSARDGRA